MSVYFVVQEEVHDPDGLNAYMEAAKASSLGRGKAVVVDNACLLYTSPSPRDRG